MAETSDILKKEHESIEQYLIELEVIMHSSVINYPNLLHVLKTLKDFWGKHEEKEDLYFSNLHKKGFTIPVKKIEFEHGILRRDMDELMRAVETRNEDKTHDALYKSGKDLIRKIRQHIADEDWILYALPKNV